MPCCNPKENPLPLPSAFRPFPSLSHHPQNNSSRKNCQLSYPFLISMADFHRPYRSDLRPPPSSAPDPAFAQSNGYFSSASAHSNGYFSSAPKNSAFPGNGDRRIEIYTKAPSTLPPPPRLALPPPPGRREGGVGGAGGGGGGSMWCFSDPEMKRRRRVASYKAYSVEGKVKASLRRGLRWFKGKCSGIFHGW